MSIETFLTSWLTFPRNLKYRNLHGTSETLTHHSTVIYRNAISKESVPYGLVNTTYYSVSTAGVLAQLRRRLHMFSHSDRVYLRFDKEGWNTRLQHDPVLLYDDYLDIFNTGTRIMVYSELTNSEFKRVTGLRNFYGEELCALCRVLRKPGPDNLEIVDAS